MLAGYGRFARELLEDLETEGLEVTTIDGGGATDEEGRGIHARGLAEADIEHASAFVAATERDTTNLWLTEAARKANSDICLVAVQNRAANTPLFDNIDLDFGMLPAEVIAHEVLARLANPMLMRFLPQVPAQGGEWAEQMIDRLVERCGKRTPDLWRVRFTEEEAPALNRWLTTGALQLGDLIRSPNVRERSLDIVPLALLRDDEAVLAPAHDLVLQPDDQLLLAGRPWAHAALDGTLEDEPTAAYVLDGEFVPAGWVWRQLSRRG